MPIETQQILTLVVILSIIWVPLLMLGIILEYNYRKRMKEREEEKKKKEAENYIRYKTRKGK